MGNKNNIKSILTGAFASCLEWYEYSLYAYFATIIGQNFFPQQDSAMLNIVYSYAVFAAGFVCRPLGSILFGMLGDIKGRKFSLALSLLCMGISTTLFAFLPTYEQAGIISTILLIILRLAQGISVGGSYGGAFVFAIEHAPKNRKFMAGGITAFGVIGGLLMGSLVSTIISNVMSQDDLVSWGWRLPYLISISAALLSYYIHKNIEETPDFKILEKLKLKKRVPLTDILKHHKLDMLNSISMLLLDAVGIYTLFIFFNVYAEHYLGIPLNTVLTINTINMCIMVLLIPLFGYISDLISGRLVIMGAASCFIVLSYPLFMTLVNSSGNIYTVLLMQTVAAIMMAACYGSLPTTISMLFPKQIRYTSTSIVFNITIAFFGGSMPLILTLIIEKTGDLMTPAYALIIVGILSLISAHMIANRNTD